MFHYTITFLQRIEANPNEPLDVAQPTGTLIEKIGQIFSQTAKTLLPK